MRAVAGHYPQMECIKREVETNPEVVEKLTHAVGRAIDDVANRRGSELDYFDVFGGLIVAIADVVMKVDHPDCRQRFAENIKWLVPESLNTALAAVAIIGDPPEPEP